MSECISIHRYQSKHSHVSGELSLAPQQAHGGRRKGSGARDSEGGCYLVAGVQRGQQHHGASGRTVDVLVSGFQSAGSQESGTKSNKSVVPTVSVTLELTLGKSREMFYEAVKQSGALFALHCVGTFLPHSLGLSF